MPGLLARAGDHRRIQPKNSPRRAATGAIASPVRRTMIVRATIRRGYFTQKPNEPARAGSLSPPLVVGV